VTNRWVTFGFSIGDSTPPFSPCIGDQPDTVGHDLLSRNQVHWVESASGFVWASPHRPLPPLPPHRNQALIGGA